MKKALFTVIVCFAIAGSLVVAQSGGNMSQSAYIVAVSVTGAPVIGDNVVANGFKAANGDMAAVKVSSRIDVVHIVCFTDQGKLTSIISQPSNNAGASNMNDYSAAVNNNDMLAMQRAIQGMFSTIMESPTIYSSGGNTANYYGIASKEHKLEITTSTGKKIVFNYDAEFTNQLFQLQSQANSSASGESSGSGAGSANQPVPNAGNRTQQQCPLCHGNKRCNYRNMYGVSYDYCQGGYTGCGKCSAKGIVNGRTCTECNGSKRVQCGICHGSGICQRCRGSGYI